MNRNGDDEQSALKAGLDALRNCTPSRYACRYCALAGCALRTQRSGVCRLLYLAKGVLGRVLGNERGRLWTSELMVEILEVGLVEC